MSAILYGLFFAVIGYQFGYPAAHNDIAMECDRLGGFYVGSTIYKCVKVEKL